MSRRISSRVYVGRLPELERARTVLSEVAAGAGRTLLVGGEFGVGKTRFLAAVADIAADAGFDVAGGRCLSSSSGLPFAGIREALRGVPEVVSDAEVAGLLGAESGQGVVSAGGERTIGPTDPGGAQAAGRLFELVLGLLRRHADRKPLMVVIDDLHWAPESTLEAFAYLVENPSPAPILMIGAHRTDIGRRHRLWSTLAGLGREPSAERVTLTRLSVDEVRELATAITADDLAPQAADALARRSGGNPLFVEELLASGTDQGGPLPDTLRDALRQRTLAVGEPAHVVLRAAAVSGAEVDERLLEAVTGLSGAALWEPIRELVDANLVVPDSARDRSVYGFRHALVREAIDEDLLPGERIQLHARIAAFLGEHPEAAPGGVAGAAGAVADHWEAGRDPGRALPAHVGAGRAAMRVHAHADAARHLDRAVALWDRLSDADRPSDERRAALLVDAAEATALTGHQPRAVELIRLALDDLGSDGDVMERAYVLDRLGQYLWEVGDDQGSRDAREQALAALPEGRELDRARILSSLASVLVVSGRHSEARVVADAALQAARAADADADAVEGAIRNTIGVLAAAEGDVDAAVVELLEARRIAERVGDAGERIRAYANLAAVLGNAGRLAEALEVAQDGVGVAREIGLYRPYGQFLVTNALVALHAMGRWAEAATLVRETLAEGTTGVIAAHLHLVAAQLAVGQGRFDAAGRSLDLAEELAARSEDPSFIVTLAATRAELAAWRGNPEAAWAVVEGARRRTGERPVAPELVTIGARVAADGAEQARARRRPADAAAMRSALDGLLDGLPAADAGTNSPYGRARAIADAEEARLAGEGNPDGFSTAAAMHEQAGLPYHAAYLRFREAEAVLTHSRVRTHAAEILLGALATARALGAEPLVHEIDALARRARIDIPQQADAAALASASGEGQDEPGSGLGLTERELEVLALIATGRTNRQIADELFISPKTAGAHVSNIIGKLGVSGRVEAATIAERAGLTKPEPASADE